ncbi:MAG: hypothetical protein ACPHF2_07035 [Crocinitomicaceae bacterium]
MIVSHKYQLIFIHIYKNAGMFVSQFLKALDPQAIDTVGHETAKKARTLLGDKIWNSYTKICVSRNSWDWQMSLLFFMKGLPSHFQHHIVKDMSVKQYLEWRKTDLHQQIEFIIDDDGKQIVDTIFRFEYLQEDILSFFLEKYNINVDNFFPRGKINASKRNSDYKHYYDEETKQMIYDMHKPDIEFFQFTYD